MKRILIFNDSLNFGGTETLLVSILNNLSDKDCQVTLLLPAPNKDDVLLKEVSEKITIRYIYSAPISRKKKIIHENFMSFFPSAYLRSVNLNLEDYDLIVSFKDSIYSTIFTRTEKRKILWIHNLPTKRKYGIGSIKEFLPVKLLKVRNKRLEKSYRKYNDVVCVSNAVRNNYTDIFNNGKLIAGQYLHVLYNAIDFSRIKKLEEESCEIKKDKPLFIMATRFSGEKRIDRVINSAKKLKEEGYLFSIIILGDGVFFEDIKKQICACSLENEISLSGYYTNPYPYMKSSDWLICSSEKESFSLVLLESIYLGTPVITTDCGGPTEISGNGKYALLVENSTHGIYEGMKKVLDNPSIADSFTSRSEECLSRFNYHEWLDSVNKLLGIGS